MLDYQYSVIHINQYYLLIPQVLFFKETVTSSISRKGQFNHAYDKQLKNGEILPPRYLREQLVSDVQLGLNDKICQVCYLPRQVI